MVLFCKNVLKYVISRSYMRKRHFYINSHKNLMYMLLSSKNVYTICILLYIIILFDFTFQ